MAVTGRAWKFGNDVNTDVIYPGTYLQVFEPEEMARHCFESVYPTFRAEVRPGDIVVAGKYFGCGSSREQAVTCLRAAGIACVIAESFARIYYRNAINRGLPILICPGIAAGVENGQTLEVDYEQGTIRNLQTGQSFQASPLPPFVLGILADGGLIPHLRKQLGTGIG